MGHIAHLRNQLKSINTFEKSYDYIITLIRRGKNSFISFLRIEWSLFVKPWVSSPKDASCQVWLKLAPWFLRGRFLNFVNAFALFRNLEKGWSFIWTNLNPLYPRMLCAKFIWNWPSGSGQEDDIVKSLQTDDGQQTIRKAPWAFRSCELKKKTLASKFFVKN